MVAQKRGTMATQINTASAHIEKAKDIEEEVGLK
jgi:hypothetical protein